MPGCKMSFKKSAGRGGRIGPAGDPVISTSMIAGNSNARSRGSDDSGSGGVSHGGGGAGIIASIASFCSGRGGR